MVFVKIGDKYINFFCFVWCIVSFICFYNMNIFLNCKLNKKWIV